MSFELWKKWVWWYNHQYLKCVICTKSSLLVQPLFFFFNRVGDVWSRSLDTLKVIYFNLYTYLFLLANFLVKFVYFSWVIDTDITYTVIHAIRELWYEWPYIFIVYEGRVIVVNVFWIRLNDWTIQLYNRI